MFDTYLLGRPRTEYVTREVHEHRAPTDESVKLLREMEQAADAKRTASMQMPGNLFQGVVEAYRNNADATIHARAVFDLNGKRLSAVVHQGDHKEPSDLLKALHQRMAEVVAAEILVDMTRGLRL